MPIQRINKATPVQELSLDLGTSASTAGLLGNTISDTLGQWKDREIAQLEQQAQQNVARQATLAQSELGTTELAQAPQALAQKYKQAYAQKSKEVFELQLKRDANTQASNLRRQFVLDPEGFADAWDSWSEGVVTEFQEGSPAFAARVKGYLDSVGSNNYGTLADNNAARQRDQLSVEGLTAIRESSAASLDLLLNDPNGDDYTTAVTELSTSVQGLVEQGLVYPDAAAKLQEQGVRELTTAFMRGQFRSYLAAGDNEGAKSLVTSLNNGKYYKDNEVGFALANEFASQLNTAGGAGLDRASRLVDIIDIEHDAIANGRPRTLSNAQLDSLLTDINAFATPEQASKAQQKLSGILYQEQFLSAVKKASFKQLSELDTDLIGTRFSISPEMRKHLATVVEDRKAVVAVASRLNEPSMLTEEVAPIATTNEEELLNFITMQQQQFHQVTGIPPEHQPTYGPEERNAFGDEFDQALASNNMERATQLIHNYTLPDQGNPSALLHSVAQLSDRGGLFYGAVTLNAVGGVRLASRFTQLAGSGRGVSPDALNSIDGVIYDRAFAAQQMASGDFGADILQGISNISMGNPAVKSSLISAVLDAYEGALVELQDEDEAQAEISRIIAPLIEGVQFSNGSQLSTMYLNDGNTVSKINDLLDNPTKLGIPANASTTTRHLIPRPLPGGAIGMYDTLAGTFLADPEDLNKVFKVVPTRPSAVAPPKEEPGFFERAAKGVIDVLETSMSWVSDEFRKGTLRAGAQSVGASPEALVAIFNSAQRVSPQAAEDRAGDLLISPEWMGDFPDADITDAGSQPIIAASILKTAAESFPDSKEKQLAMYWLGPDSTEDLVTQYGSEWLNFVDPDTDAFISRAMETFK